MNRLQDRIWGRSSSSSNVMPAHTLKRGDQSQVGNVLVVTSRTGTAAATGNNEDSSRNLMISHCVNRPPYYVQIGGLAGAIIPPYTVNSSPLETIWWRDANLSYEGWVGLNAPATDSPPLGTGFAHV